MTEKKPIYMDALGNRRDPNRKGDPILCSAKSKRTGELCKNIAMPNSKCRVHGGLSTGPKTAEGKERISKAVKQSNTRTGEHQAIWYDTLTEEEKYLMAQNLIPKDAISLLTEAIAFDAIRERRMMQRIAKEEAKDESITVEERYQRRLLRDKDGQEFVHTREDGSVEKLSEMQLESKGVRRESNIPHILAIEEALTRIQQHKQRLIEMKLRVEQGEVQEEDGSLDQLCGILNGIREQRQKNVNRVQGNL